MSWKKLKSSTKATFKNPNFQSFHELGKRFNVEPKTNIQKSQFESKGELRKTKSQFEFHC